MLVRAQGPYQYGTMNQEGRQMRVLTLLPSIDTKAEINCTLAVADVDHLPNYEALSYSWGATGDNCHDPTYIDGHAVTVSSNLEAALRALRLPRKSKAPWIDAVCIDQNDVAERAIQVMMMGTIYSKAKRVLIWLGVPSEDSALAILSLANLKSKKSIEQISPLAHKAIENVISRPYSWFSRAWVVQELTLARNIVFNYGPDFFQWPRIGSFLGLFSAHVEDSVPTSARATPRARRLTYSLGATCGRGY